MSVFTTTTWCCDIDPYPTTPCQIIFPFILFWMFVFLTQVRAGPKPTAGLQLDRGCLLSPQNGLVCSGSTPRSDFARTNDRLCRLCCASESQKMHCCFVAVFCVFSCLALRVAFVRPCLWLRWTTHGLGLKEAPLTSIVTLPATPFEQICMHSLGSLVVTVLWNPWCGRLARCLQTTTMTSKSFWVLTTATMDCGFGSNPLRHPAFHLHTFARCKMPKNWC